jgi:hypothetical protein
MRFQTLATMLACIAAFASLGANATETEPYQDAAYNGGYVIEVLPNNTVDHSQPKCMIFDAAQGAYGVRTHRWTTVPTGLCGLGHVTAHTENKQAVWDIAPVKHTDGRKAYVIRSRVNGQCLIRSNNGQDNSARLFSWNATNPALCGWGNEDALIDNGQAAWVLGDSTVVGENIVSSIGALRNGVAFLSFASNNNGLRAGQTMLAVDHEFRLTRVPENCTNHALQPDIMRVCGVGDFAQPVRVRDSAYLQMRFSPWNATASSENFYGNWNVEYMAIYPNDAHLYCSRLRTGNFSDWRMPTLAELRAMSAAFSNDALKASGWATGYRGHQTTDRFEYRGKTYFYSVRFYNGDVGEEWDAGDANPYPISCIR